jgi:hypothetical protein
MTTTTQAISYTRTLSAADSDIAQLPQWNINGAQALVMAALCDTANAAIQARLVGFTADGQLAAVSPVINFTASATADYSGLFSATPDSTAFLPASGMSFGSVKVDTLSAGNWTIVAGASFAIPSNSL